MNPAPSPHLKNKYIFNNTAVTPQGKKQYLCGVISKRYGI
jgi:hypothetical protein